MGLLRSRLTRPPWARLGLLAAALSLAGGPAFAEASGRRPIDRYVAAVLGGSPLLGSAYDDHNAACRLEAVP